MTQKESLSLGCGAMLAQGMITKEAYDRFQVLIENAFPDLEFVAYSGSFPNLCSGTLQVRLNGELFELEGCMSSGGSCSWGDGDEIVYGDWEIELDALPDALKPYINDLERLVNENVEHGCCGGCL